jgi:hypothetical protein
MIYIKIYAGNLAFEADDRDLRALFRDGGVRCSRGSYFFRQQRPQSRIRRSACSQGQRRRRAHVERNRISRPQVNRAPLDGERSLHPSALQGMSSEKPERRYPLDAIPWPQSVCSGCSRIGSGVDPFRFCRCLEPFITIYSARSYLALRAKAHAPREASMPGWSKRRAG